MLDLGSSVLAAGSAVAISLSYTGAVKPTVDGTGLFASSPWVRGGPAALTLQPVLSKPHRPATSVLCSARPWLLAGIRKLAALPSVPQTADTPAGAPPPSDVLLTTQAEGSGLRTVVPSFDEPAHKVVTPLVLAPCCAALPAGVPVAALL